MEEGKRKGGREVEGGEEGRGERWGRAGRGGESAAQFVAKVFFFLFFSFSYVKSARKLGRQRSMRREGAEKGTPGPKPQLETAGGPYCLETVFQFK